MQMELNTRTRALWLAGAMVLSVCMEVFVHQSGWFVGVAGPPDTISSRLASLSIYAENAKPCKCRSKREPRGGLRAC